MNKMDLSNLEQIFTEIDSKKQDYIQDLSDACAIKSVSAWIEHREELQRMVEWTTERLKNLGVNCELADAGNQTLPTGEVVALPNVILGSLGSDPQKKTVCVYGHLDVQPALKEDGWDTDPFVLTEKDEKLYGRGASDDKGPILCWLHSIEAYQKLNIALPVNLKFIFEGMEESGSEGLEKLLVKKNDFLANIEYICISDNYWLGKKKPCITYGLRGLCRYFIEIECASRDLHSGVFGGSVHEAMTDLIYLLNTLVDKNGKILVTDLEKNVMPLMSDEKSLYESIDFDIEEFRKDIGAAKLRQEEKAEILMHIWRYPSLSIHGIEGAFCKSGQKTVIPSKVIGKFSIRIVPNQTPEEVNACVKKYLEKKWEERTSPNKIKIYPGEGSNKFWIEDYKHSHYEAAKAAVKDVFGIYPDFTREGGAIPVATILKEITNKNVLLLPIGSSDDGAHSQNEKINISNYIQGTKLISAYLYEMGKLND